MQSDCSVVEGSREINKGDVTIGLGMKIDSIDVDFTISMA